MKEIIATLTSNGRVTIPMEIRKHLGLDSGAKVAFVVDAQGDVTMCHAETSAIASVDDAATTFPNELPHLQ